VAFPVHKKKKSKAQDKKTKFSCLALKIESIVNLKQNNKAIVEKYIGQFIHYPIEKILGTPLDEVHLFL
jgi:hypothetical protein